MKYSYKLILALCIIGLFSGCNKIIEEDDTPAGAIDQLSITGRIIDHNNQPVKNIHVVFYFFRSGQIESLNRKKATSMTDETAYISSPYFVRLTKIKKEQKRTIIYTLIQMARNISRQQNIFMTLMLSGQKDTIYLAIIFYGKANMLK